MNISFHKIIHSIFATMLFFIASVVYAQSSDSGHGSDRSSEFFIGLPEGDWITYVNGNADSILKSGKDSNVYKIENAIQELAEKHEYGQALEKLTKLEGMPHKMKSDYTFLYRTRLAIGGMTSDRKLQIGSIQALLDKNLYSNDEKVSFQRYLAKLYFAEKEYSSAISLARAAQEKETDDDLEKIVIASYTSTNDFSGAATELDRVVKNAEASHQAPSREMLHLLVQCNLKAGNQPAYMASIEKYLSYYSDSGYWAELLNSLVSKPGFSERLSMDVYRLMYATGQFTQGRELEDIAQQALNGGYAGFGEQVVEEGIKSGKINGTGGSEQVQILRKKATQAADAELTAIGKQEYGLNANTNPDMLAAIGYTYVDHGKVEKGIDYLNKAIASGRLKYPDDAKLHLAMAYAKAGQSQAALDMLKDVKGNDGTAQLAHYWAIYIKQAINPSIATTSL